MGLQYDDLEVIGGMDNGPERTVIRDSEGEIEVPYAYIVEAGDFYEYLGTLSLDGYRDHYYRLDSHEE